MPVKHDPKNGQFSGGEGGFPKGSLAEAGRKAGNKAVLEGRNTAAEINAGAVAAGKARAAHGGKKIGKSGGFKNEIIPQAEFDKRVADKVAGGMHPEKAHMAVSGEVDTEHYARQQANKKPVAKDESSFFGIPKGAGGYEVGSLAEGKARTAKDGGPGSGPHPGGARGELSMHADKVSGAAARAGTPDVHQTAAKSHGNAMMEAQKLGNKQGMEYHRQKYYDHTAAASPKSTASKPSDVHQSTQNLISSVRNSERHPNFARDEMPTYGGRCLDGDAQSMPAGMGNDGQWKF